MSHESTRSHGMMKLAFLLLLSLYLFSSGNAVSWDSKGRDEAKHFSELVFGNYGTHTEESSVPPATYYPGTMKDLRAPCKFEYKPLKEAKPDLLVYHFPDKESYKTFNGTDYTPWNAHKIPKNSNWMKMKKGDGSNLKHALCRLPPDEEGNRWNIERIGPFTSRGCYDWWQLAWHDVLNFKKDLEKGQVQLTGRLVSAVSTDGEDFGYPPMHMHHIHFVPKKPFLRYQWPVLPGNISELLGQVKEKVWGTTTFYFPNLMDESHGEWDPCHSRSDKPGCFWEKYPEGYGMTLEEDFDVEGEFNDGRACNSEPIQWWFEVGFRWSYVKERPLKPMSKQFIGEASLTLRTGDQTTYENFYWTPTKQGLGFNYYTTKAVHSGKLLRTKSHNHMTSLRRTFLVRGSAEELGLDKYHPSPPTLAGLQQKTQWCPLSDTPFKTFADMERDIIAKARALNSGSNPVICEAWAGLHFEDGFTWDYPGNSSCYPARLEKGEYLTSIAFHEYRPEEPNLPGPWLTYIPDDLPVHNEWFIMMDTEDHTSYSGASWGFIYKIGTMGTASRVLAYNLDLCVQIIFNYKCLLETHYSQSYRTVMRWIAWGEYQMIDNIVATFLTTLVCLLMGGFVVILYAKKTFSKKQA